MRREPGPSIRSAFVRTVSRYSLRQKSKADSSMGDLGRLIVYLLPERHLIPK